MSDTEPGGTPVDAADFVAGTAAPEAEAPEADPAATPTTDASTDGSLTPSESGKQEAESPADTTAEKDKSDQLHGEVSRLSNAILNRKINDLKETRTQDGYDALDQAGRNAYLERTPGAKILTEIDFLRSLSADRLAREPVALDKSDPPYIFKGDVLGSLTAVDADTFTCTISGSTETITISRDELVALAIGGNMEEVLKNFPEGSPQRKLIQTFGDTSATGSKLTAEQMATLPDLITEVAEAHGIITTGNLRRAGEHYFTHTDIPPTATAEESARITAENVQKAADLAELRKQLGENSLASAQQIKSTMELLGITPANLSKTLETVRASIPAIEKAIANEKDDVKKKDYKERLDTLRATADIYQEVQGMLDPTDTEGKHIQKYLDDQRAGTVTIELGKSIAAHMEKGEIETLIQMVSPESSVTATAEQKKKFREAREKHDRILKGVGITAAVLALLIALGISQGAKQQ